MVVFDMPTEIITILPSGEGPVGIERHDCLRDRLPGFQMGGWRRVHSAGIQSALLALVHSCAEIRQRNETRGLARRVFLDPLLPVDLAVGLHMGLLLRREHLQGPLLKLGLLLLLLLRRGNRGEQRN
jgi:hypothetical protein